MSFLIVVAFSCRKQGRVISVSLGGDEPPARRRAGGGDAERQRPCVTFASERKVGEAWGSRPPARRSGWLAGDSRGARGVGWEPKGLSSRLKATCGRPSPLRPGSRKRVAVSGSILAGERAGKGHPHTPTPAPRPPPASRGRETRRLSVYRETRYIHPSSGCAWSPVTREATRCNASVSDTEIEKDIYLRFKLLLFITVH